jgi:hypothetical protein
MGGVTSGVFPMIKCSDCGGNKLYADGIPECCECAAKKCKEVELLLCDETCYCGKHPKGPLMIQNKVDQIIIWKGDYPQWIAR